MTKIRLNLESLDARIVPDANPGNPMPPPATVEISVPVTPPMMPPPTNAPPGLDAQVILEAMRVEYKAALDLVTADIAKVMAQLDKYGNAVRATIAAQMALQTGAIEDQPALAVKLDAALVAERAAKALFGELVGQYRLDRDVALQLQATLQQFCPSGTVVSPPPRLVPAVNILVPAVGDTGTI